MQYNVRQMDLKLAQIEAVKKDLALVEQHSQQKQNDALT